ncbi:ferulic acid esterase [Massariosphaeria phaeospora]|uniref:Carboxylic ester hydrolase n=1 Tax=Massariosphaeria phaeospora TaxID=100035 RepID=A0A7C8LZY3_9PLEO|nr:ferulic acid esterase [Massariosphaeria phaeospora]
MRYLPTLAGYPLLTVPAFGRESYPNQSFSSRCVALANNLTVPGYAINVNIAEFLPANATIDHAAEGVDATCAAAWPAPPLPSDICRLVLRVATSNASEILLETWLPEEWNGRFLSVGNGGLAGCVQYPDLAFGTSYGFATAGHNAGHNGTSGASLFHRPHVLEDLVWRSVYVGTMVGKDVTRQIYGRDAGKSYYTGCSMGGRQGFKAVQKNPELFDGVIAGAPGIAVLTSHFALFGHAVNTLRSNTSDGYLTTEDWTVVQDEVLKQCDELDGAKDGIVEDVRQCHPDLATLLCTQNQSACLTSPQLSTIEALFAPIKTSNGTVLHPGPSHSFEVALTAILQSPEVANWIVEWWRYVVYEDETWDPASWTLADLFAARTQNPFDFDTLDADLSAFQARGGKLLHWHGQADPYLAVGISDTYYNSVLHTLNTTVSKLDEFYRYFRISGMDHCFGGPGTNYLGQYGMSAAGDSPDDNMLTRIVEWVENSDAPEIVRGTKFVNDSREAGVAFTRRHCKHPRVNVYKGSEDGTDEDGWECVEGKI